MSKHDLAHVNNSQKIRFYLYCSWVSWPDHVTGTRVSWPCYPNPGILTMLPVPRCFDHITGTLVSWPCYLCTGLLTMLPVPRYFDHANGTRVSWPCYQYLGFLTILPVLRYHDHVTGIQVSWPFYWYSGILTNDHAFHPAREWVSSATVMWMVKELIENNAAHSDLTQVDQHG